MPTHLDIIAALEEVCPLSLQETWDNSGWQVGNPHLECTGAMLAVEATEATVQEALENGCNLLITHHPLLFRPLKRIGCQTYQERTVALAIKHDVAIYSAHTNADNAAKGINYYLAERLQLQQTRALVAQPCNLYKLSVMVPTASAPEVESAMCAAGAGRLGCYDSCSFSVEGRGHFRPLEGANPAIGSLGELEEVAETQISLLVEPHLVHKVIEAIYASHPYEVPAYELISLATPQDKIGTGVIGELPQPISEEEFLKKVSQWSGVKHVAYSHPLGKAISRVALCGGSGGSFLSNAIAQHADVYLTGEGKYNDYLDAAGHLLFVTIGHHESESIARRLFSDIISAKFPNFALRESLYDNNPVNHL